MNLYPALTTESDDDENLGLGTIRPIHISDEEVLKYSQNLQTFEAEAVGHSRSIISNIFAFLFHPINPQLPCTLLHLVAATNGKASNVTVQRLFTL
jgi:hypothetical protein